MAADRERFVANRTFEALPDDAPAIVRMRALLKRALRSFKLKCTHYRELTPPAAAVQAPAPPPAEENPC
jgi:hypothetical protein